MTYLELFAMVKAVLENDFPSTVFTDSPGTSTITVTGTTQVDTFIRQAETRIYNSIQFPSLRKNSFGLTTADNKYLACPNDFLASYSLAVVTGQTGTDLDTGTYNYLLNKDANFIRESFPTPNDTGVPEYYALFGPQVAADCTVSDELSFILGPTPDDAYYVQLSYFYYPESIVDATSGHTWLGDNFDPILLYGAILEGYVFLKGEADMMMVYKTKYDEAVALAKRLGDGLERRDAYRSGQARVDVT